MYKDRNEYIKISEDNNIKEFCIRSLNYDDIEQIAIARIQQENENGNGATREYIEEYQNVLKRLFKNNKIISSGAFEKEKLVSLAFFNLISFGNEKKTTYLCGVWTNPEYRGKGLASQVYKKLVEGAYERKKELQTDSLLTIEGNEAAFNLYKKLGYIFVNGEMTFLGDVKSPKNIEIENDETDKSSRKEIYYENRIKKMQIEYSAEQFFSHPTNITGCMSRITGIQLFDPKITSQEFKTCLRKFFSGHRFCKFNIKELIDKTNFKSIFETSDYEELLQEFEKMEFEGTNGEKLQIKRSNNIMSKSMVKDFEYLEDRDSER